MPSKIQPKSLIKKNEKQKGGLESKDDPDKKDKNDYDASENEEVDEEENEEDLENIEETEESESESEPEEIDKEKEEDGEAEEAADGDDSCIYKFTKKKQVIDLDLNLEDQFEDEQDGDMKSIYVPNNERMTKKILFNYERVRLLGERARQLSLGAKPMLKNVDTLDAKTIAKLELEHKVIPLIILRELPNGRIEKWKVSELKF